MTKHRVYNDLVNMVLPAVKEAYNYSNESQKNTRKVSYISAEYLPGRFLGGYLLAFDMEAKALNMASKTCYSLEEVLEVESEPGLGSGGLGRLASCITEGAAKIQANFTGYGLRYNKGLFKQHMFYGYQTEVEDNWMDKGNPFEIRREDRTYMVPFSGYSVRATACDIPVIAPKHHHCTRMRLWDAGSITDTLYPESQELRLQQQYVLTSATLQDLLRDSNVWELHVMNTIQLNDTHPVLAIPELMRLLMDVHGLGWDHAWDICREIFNYTCHTVLIEALEEWSVDMLSRNIPRCLEIIYEINHRFMKTVPEHLKGSLSIFSEDGSRVKMAALAIHTAKHVNGVAEIHTGILKRGLFDAFDRFYPGKIMNVTNGVSVRKWLEEGNPRLSTLIDKTIGNEWRDDMTKMEGLSQFCDGEEFQAEWRQMKYDNKKEFSDYVQKETGYNVIPHSLVSCYAKRFHTYKRPNLTLLSIIALYHRVLNGERLPIPRTFIFAGKAASTFKEAKAIIKMVSILSDTINNDDRANDQLRVIFLPNYAVTMAQMLFKGSDVTSHVSCAGLEAAGTSNMKTAMNGAVIIGTWDGATCEIVDKVGHKNAFIFGMSAEDVEDSYRRAYDPSWYYHTNDELKAALDYIRSTEARLVADSLLGEDRYRVLADYNDYMRADHETMIAYQDRERWTRISILNAALCPYFSSDRTVIDYCNNIWNI